MSCERYVMKPYNPGVKVYTSTYWDMLITCRGYSAIYCVKL
jgi:hypothetical protein